MWAVIAPGSHSPALQMALDEVLLSRVGSGRRPPTFRLWRWIEPALVIGSHQSVSNEVDAEAAAALGFVVVRRMSGGGTMIAEPGRTITYSLYAPESEAAGLSFTASYEAFDRFAVRAFRGLGIDAGYRPVNDLVSPRGKIGGAAQARRRGVVLHHTTIAHSMDVSLVRRLIRIGRPGPSAVGVRSAEKDVSPLDWFTTASLEAVEAALKAAFADEHPAGEGTVAADELDEARHLAATKYQTEEWTYRLP